MSELPSLVIQVVQGLRARNGRLCAAFLAILPSFSVSSSNSTGKVGGCLKANRLGVDKDLSWSLKANRSKIDLVSVRI